MVYSTGRVIEPKHPPAIKNLAHFGDLSVPGREEPFSDESFQYYQKRGGDRLRPWIALSPGCPALDPPIRPGGCFVDGLYDSRHIGTDHGPVDRGQGDDSNRAAMKALLIFKISVSRYPPF